MPSIWDLVSYFVALGGTLHSTYDLLLQHDVVIAGELGVREAGPKGLKHWSWLFWGKEFSLVFFKGSLSLSNFQLFGFLKVLFFFVVSFNLPKTEGNWDDANETGPAHIFPRLKPRGQKSPCFLLVVLGDEILPCIIWELIHKLIRHEIRIPF